VREIKFRVWTGKEMSLPFDLGDLHDGCCYNDEFGARVDSDKHIVMQYTGLKDKNGKEIFEGDILISDITDVPDSEKFEYRRCVVKFKNGCFSVFYEPHEYIATLISFIYTNIGLGDGPHVIGNIYQHSELLDAEA